MNEIQLRQIIREEIKKALKENLKLNIEGDYVELQGNSGTYSAFIEDNGTVNFSVVYDDDTEFDEDNWKDILGPNHTFVQISNEIPTKVEAIDDYVMITVNLEDLKKISNEPKGMFGEPWDSDDFGRHLRF